jgi:hypothetical protein
MQSSCAVPSSPGVGSAAMVDMLAKRTARTARLREKYMIRVELSTSENISCGFLGRIEVLYILVIDLVKCWWALSSKFGVLEMLEEMM